MFFNKKFTEDDFEDIERYEEYQRRKSETIIRGGGNFFSKIFSYSFIYLFAYLVLALFLINLVKVEDSSAYMISLVMAFFIFKVRYVKEYPFRSLLMLVFIMFLEFVMFDGVKI